MMIPQKIFLALLLILFVGCAHKNAPTQEQVEIHGEQLKQLSQSKIVQILAEPYLGARSVSIEPQSDPVLSTHVTLSRKGTLQELCSSIATLTSLPVQITGDGDIDTSTPPDPTIDPAFGNVLAVPGKKLSVSYEGSLGGLLDHITSVSGYGWEYKSGAITFSLYQTRTFTLLSAIGTIQYSNTLTNKSKESKSSNGLGSGVNQTVSTSDTSSQNAQSNSVSLDIDVWKEVTEAVKSLLSPRGTVTGSKASGTVTVRDNAARMRHVAAYIDDVNTRFSRQVALQIQVWALELNDDSEAGLNLQAIFNGGDVSVIAGTLSDLGSYGSASVAVVSGKLKDSKGVLSALNEWGSTSVVTSGIGIVMSNTPFPVQAIRSQGYLASISTTTNSDYGQTAELTPGEVTDGFAMTVVPHILDARRVILQYNVILSNLNSLTEFSTADVKIQLPQVATRSFSQRTILKMGQTLVLAGFQQESQQQHNTVGFLSGGRNAGYGKTLLVITIQVESAEI